MKFYPLISLLLVAHLTVAAAATPAAPEYQLLSGLQAAFDRPQRRCEWIAGHFAQADQILSLYREELAVVYVALDGTRIADSTGGLRRVELETRLFGPNGAAVSVDLGRVPASLRSGSAGLLEIGFTDRRGPPAFLWHRRCRA